MIEILCGDMREVLKTLPENHFDSIVTDPPYGISFSGKDWDHAVPGPEYWAEAFRVVKPGGMLLAFGGTRTYHRLACAIEDTGWELRDCCMWLYGSGFPKSLNIGKQFDKQAGVKGEVVGYQKATGNTRGKGAAGGYANGLTGIDGYEVVKEAWEIYGPATDMAKLWEGWGTALKPAYEPIILAMKPLEGNYRDNAAKYGVAGLNIDGTRIGECPGYQYNADKNGTTFHGEQGDRIKRTAEKNGSLMITATKGRWPANLILDEEAGKMLDDQAGIHPGCKSPSKVKKASKFRPNQGESLGQGPIYADTGGVSRFFYCAKANKKERGDFNLHPTVKPLALMKYLLTLVATPTGGYVLDPFAGSGTTLLAAKQLGRDCLGIELDPHHCEIISRRLKDD
jgi:site-specific DNA-methyltransferase (adenine-specific)